MNKIYSPGGKFWVEDGRGPYVMIDTTYPESLYTQEYLTPPVLEEDQAGPQDPSKPQDTTDEAPVTG